jgi:hypothetical protein
MSWLRLYRVFDRPVADQLRRAPLFEALPTDRHDCLGVLREGAVFAVPAGVKIVTPGDAASLMVVTEGALAQHGSARGWAAGQYLGASEILARRPFEVGVSTVGPTLIYRLESRLLDAFLTRCPAIAERLLHELARVAAGGADREPDRDAAISSLVKEQRT